MGSRTWVSLVMIVALPGLAGLGCNGAYDAVDPATEAGQKFVSVQTEPATEGPTAEQMEAARLDLHAALLAARVEPGLDKPVVVEISQAELFDHALVEAEGRTVAPGPKLIGVVHPVGVPVDLAAAGQVGAMRAERDRFVWTGLVRAEDAKAIRLHLTDVELPKGTGLYVYNDSGEAYGPFTGSGELWSPSVTGTAVHLQVHGEVPAGRFVIADVGYVDPQALSLDAPVASEKYNIGSQCYGAWCTENANCHNWTHMAATKKAVAHIQYIDGPYIYLCSGGLLADSDTGSQIPYFLTANHCVSTQSVADTLEAFFQFEAVCSSDCGDAEQDSIKVAGGASVLRTNSTSDFTLLRLDGTPPADSVYLGWSSQAVAFSNGDMLHRIAHPAGGPQSYSEHRVDTAKGTCGSWPRGNWIYSTDTLGATEGGSSGSVVLNASGQVVGQLSGACGTNVNDNCDTVRNATVDGAFAAYYDQVSAWLGTGAGCTVPADCDDGNVCNGAEDCVAGDCVSGTALDCDDGNPCTDDDCDAAAGCLYVNNTASCSDGDACTVGDQCSGGACQGGAPRDGDNDSYVDEACGGNDCDDGDPDINPGASELCGDGVDNNCDSQVDEGCGCSIPADCDDANPCTDDDCVSGSCVNANNTAACDDGNACTVGDQCSGGACASGPLRDGDTDGYVDAACGGNDCNDSDPNVNPGVSEVCDDGIDNNCDGGVDEGCSCLPYNAWCSVNADCCSNYCRGWWWFKRCR